MCIVHLFQVFARVQHREHGRGNNDKILIKNEKINTWPNIILNPLKQKIKTQIKTIKISPKNNKKVQQQQMNKIFNKNPFQKQKTKTPNFLNL